jgi:hypothetical protein
MALDAGWDIEMLKVELKDLEDMKFDLTITGFDLGEMASMFDQPVVPDSSTKEIDPDEYAMDHRCPKCGFEFDE